MPDGWASWDEQRAPRIVFNPQGVERVRYCPKCAEERIFAPSGEADDLMLCCVRCRYRAGDVLTDNELILLMDRYKLPVPLIESRVAP